jgi:hypothetical protein
MTRKTMMIRIERRWQELEPAPDKPVFQLLDAEHPLRLYIGREMAGDFLFLLVDREKPPAMKSMRSVQINSSQRSDGHWSLVLRLVQPELVGLFALLCEDLVSSSSHLPRGSSGMKFFSRRLANWRKLLEEGKDGLLGPSEVRGLFGELWVLEQHFLEKFGVNQGVAAWVGPYGADQDFQLPDHAWEVKSIQVDAPAIQVASERQLYSSERILRLIVLTLENSIRKEDPSLNAIVDRLRVRLQDFPDAREALDERLTMAGYMVRREYDAASFRCGTLRAFDVCEGFPRITTEHVMQGVHDVSYMLALDACSPFRINDPFEGT